MNALRSLSPVDQLLLIGCTVAIGVTILLGAAAEHGHDLLPSTNVCWSVQFLGRDCPGCGLTRSFVTLGRGRIVEAGEINPLGPPLFSALLGFSAVRGGKLAAPGLKIWRAADLSLAVAVGLALLTRTILFYF